ncbi:MAG: hypothetical protein ACM3SU_17930 [Acidobacteriota bacterium]
MGTDLVSACIFCAGFLLGIDLPPRAGLGTEIGLSYATLARRYPVAGEPVDDSDVTPKFVLIGLGNAHPAAGDLGAGTPVFEWRVRVAFGPSHDEQVRDASPTQVRASANGTGRYENFSLLGRLPIGGSDSVEASLDRRSHKATDVINIGGGEHAFSEERTLSAERGDGAIGWRHRFRDAEVAAAVRYVKLTGFNATANAYDSSSGGLWGGNVEARLRRGRWSLLAHYERLSGSIDVLEESFPDFHPRHPPGDSVLEAARLGLGYSWPRTELWATAAYDRSRLPFVALAVLGTETLGFDGGFHPESRTRQFFGDLSVRRAFTESIRARLTIRMATGDETVALTDSAGVLPSRSLDVQRRGRFGGGLSGTIGWPELTFFLGADFSIGGGR